MKICPICGKENEDDQTLCLCGFNFHGTDYIPSSNEGKSRSIVREKKRRLLGKRQKRILCLVAVLIALCAVGCAVYYNANVHWNKSFDPVLYVADGKIMCADVAKPYAAAMEVDASQGETADYFSLPDSLYINADNSLIVYPNNYQTSEGSFSTVYDLYLFDFKNPGSEPIRIAQAVSSHTVNEAFDTVTCFKGEGKDAGLYQYDMNGNETLIADSVYSYSISLKGEIIYETHKGRIYFKAKDKEPSLVSKKGSVVFVAEDFSEFFIVSSGKLTKHTPDGKKTLIDEDVAADSHFDFGFSGGKGYYIKLQKEYPLSDYFIDDMASKDKEAGLSEEKLLRDEIRLEIYGEKAKKICLYSLYYYDGEKSHFVADNVSYGYTEEEASAALCAFSVSEKQEFEKVRMSEFSALVENSDVYSLYAYLTLPENMNEKHYICFEGKSLPVTKAKSSDTVGDLRYNAEENSVYFTVSDSELVYADLYKSKINSEKLSQAELIAGDISAIAFYTLPNGCCVYMRENEKGEDETSFSLYLNGELLDEAVIGYHEFNYPVENLLFLESYSPDAEEYAYIHINENGVNKFMSTVNIDYGASVQFTEKDGIIIYDDMVSDGSAVFAKGDKAREVYLGTAFSDINGLSSVSFSVPHHPEAIINEINYDWSELM